MMTRKLLSLAALAVASAQSTNCTLGKFPASAWPAAHTRTEMMYEPFLGPVWSRKPVWYDFANLNYRADVFFVGGNSDPLITLFNFSSFWAPNGTLYMITWADPRSILNSSCIALDLGFGIMRPDWMQQGSCMGDMWVTPKSSVDTNYYRSVWTQIPVLNDTQGLGSFNWYSDYTTGEGRMMQAPGANSLDYVINEESLLTPAAFAPNDPIFTIPADRPACIDAGSPQSYEHAGKLLAAAGASPAVLAALPEIRLAYHLRALHKAGVIDRSTAEAVASAA